MLYRLIDVVGRWSNIDVFMVSILAASLQFGFLTTVDPEAGIISFAAVVVLTMLATAMFDPRLMWDGRADDGHPLPAGVYLAKLKVAGLLVFKRIVFRGK